MTTLANVNEPLVLADGTVINPMTGHVEGEDPDAEFEDDYVEVPTNTEAVKRITAVNRKIADLPDIPKHMNGVSVILCYTLFGLNDFDIATATGLTLEQVGSIKMSDAYAKFNNEIVDTLLQQEQEDVRTIINQGMKTAANKVVRLVSSTNTAIALAASKDILDRGGHRPVDVVEHRHKMEDSLEIVITRKDESIKKPIIDI